MNRAQSLAQQKRIQARRDETLPEVFEALCDVLGRGRTGPIQHTVDTDRLVAALAAYAGPEEQVEEPPWITVIRRTLREYERTRRGLAEAKRARDATRAPSQGLGVFDLDGRR